MQYRLAIFDFDGTLADTFPWFASTLDGVAQRYGFRPPRAEEVERFRCMSAREILADLGVPIWKVPFIARHMRSLATRDVAQFQLFAGASELLRELSSAGVDVAVVSSNTRQNVACVLGPNRVPLLSAIDCSASLTGKAAKFRRILRSAGIAPGAAIAIGDEIRDAEAAREVGIAFGGVTWGYTRGRALAATRPTFLFETVSEIGPALLGGAYRRVAIAADGAPVSSAGAPDVTPEPAAPRRDTPDR